jgi:hypothetical protein
MSTRRVRNIPTDVQSIQISRANHSPNQLGSSVVSRLFVFDASGSATLERTFVTTYVPTAADDAFARRRWYGAT